MALGPEKSFALTRYAHASPPGKTVRNLLESGVKIGGKPLESVSVRDIQAATRALRQQRSGRPSTTSGQERRHCANLQQRLKKAGFQYVTAGPVMM